jgi:hypothetical protein
MRWIKGHQPYLEWCSAGWLACEPDRVLFMTSITQIKLSNCLLKMRIEKHGMLKTVLT